jgi:AcrR family transcriptional regulator
MIEETLRQHIARSKESLNAIAKAAGIDYGTLYRFVHEKRNIQVDSVQKLCRYFGLELKYSDGKVIEVLRKAVDLLVKAARRDFRHRNGRLNRQAIAEFVLSHPRLPASNLDDNERQVAAYYDWLAVDYRARLLDKALDSLSFAAMLATASIKRVSELDRDLQELKEAYQPLDDDGKDLLQRLVLLAEEFQKQEYRLQGSHSFVIKIDVGHSYCDEVGNEAEGNRVTLRPVLVRKALDAWRAGKEFTPESMFDEFT